MSRRVPHLCGYIYPLCNNLEVCEPTLELWSLSGTCAWSPLVPPPEFIFSLQRDAIGAVWEGREAR